MNDPQKGIEVLGLFPQPVFTRVYMGNDLTSTVSFLDRTELMGDMPDQYGYHSKDTYILDAPECAPLKAFVMDSLKHFGQKVLMYDYDEYALSQSWVSHKLPGQHHTMHTHPNSLISGVFYYGESDSSTPAIKFHKPVFGANASYMAPQYQADRRPSEYAWETFAINHAPGLLILFPSYMLHSVPTNESNFTRKSLAFNVQPKGSLGYRNNLTELLFNKVI